MRAVEYDTFLPTKEKDVKGTTAHARYNKRFSVFKSMSG